MTAADAPTTPIIDMLDELLERGMKLARFVSDQALKEMAAPGSAELKPQGTDPRQLFLRIWTAMRQTIALQTRLIPGPKTPAPAKHSGKHPAMPDTRRDIIRAALDIATATHPNRVKIRMLAQQRADQALARDPEGKTPLPDHIATICQQCGIKFDKAKLAS